MRFTIISDTHGKHKALRLPPGDVLLHCGDISYNGCKRDIISFYEWFSQQPFTHKLFVAGNHDSPFTADYSPIKLHVPYNVVYLQDSGVEIQGVKVWGSPVTPVFRSSAFTVAAGAPIRAHWQGIPTDTDILLTHGPALGVCDQNANNIHAGCAELAGVLDERRVQVHAHGHIHEAHGVSIRAGRISVNASVVNKRYEVVNPPIHLFYADGRFSCIG